MVEVDVDHHGPDETDHVWVSRILPADSLTATVPRALDRKWKKLVAEPVIRHLLLLEKADFVPAHSKIRVRIDTLSQEFAELAKVDEVWLVITGTGKTENVLFFSELHPDVTVRRLMLNLRSSVTMALGA